MKHLGILIVFSLMASQQVYSQEGAIAAAFSRVEVKKKFGGKICDTCITDYALLASPEFSYLITGARHNYTPHRFNALERKEFISVDGQTALSATRHFISQRNIGITFLPNFLKEHGKRTQLYRNYSGEDYINLEFAAKQKGKVIRPWTPLSALGGDKDYAILGTKMVSDQTVSIPWKRTFFAGNFNLNVKDTLGITIRNIRSKQVIQHISIVRPVDRATNFMYYQLPLRGDQLSTNLQDILNVSSGIPEVYHGDSSSVFEKEAGTIGLLRFGDLSQYEEIQFSFEETPSKWQTIKNLGPGGAFIVLGNDMQEGKDHEISLRYKSQPETIHKITIRVKKKPLVIPWGMIAVISILLLAAGGIAFYLWNKRNEQRLAALKSKNTETETRLSLLSGQLNPHFLFNSLNAIQGTINSSNPERANAYIGNVAGFMRDVMDNSKKEFISLQEELELEAHYLTLEQERMAFSYTIAYSPEIDPSLIDFPPLLLQPVLENSIRHAFTAGSGNSAITINVSRESGTLFVEISDNGLRDWETREAQEGHGLTLIRKRIAVYNEKLESMHIQMQIKYQQGRGTVTTFTFQNWLA